MHILHPRHIVRYPPGLSGVSKADAHAADLKTVIAVVVEAVRLLITETTPISTRGLDLDNPLVLLLGHGLLPGETFQSGLVLALDLSPLFDSQVYHVYNHSICVNTLKLVAVLAEL